MRRTEVIEGIADFGKIAGLWRALYQNDPAATLFQAYDINREVATLFARRERPYVVAVEDDSGAAIIPACIHATGLKFIGDEMFDYPNVLANASAPLEYAWRILETLDAPLRIHGIKEAPFWGNVAPFSGAPFRLASDRLHRHPRMERNRSALCTAGCEFARLTRSEALLVGVREMYTLKGAHPSGGLFSDPLRIDGVVTMCAFAEAEPELHVIRSGKALVAAALTFVDRGTCRFYGTYFDARWGMHSPGVTLLYQTVREAQDRGLDFDFMTGEQPYKMRFATGVQPLHRLVRVPVPALKAA